MQHPAQNMLSAIAAFFIVIASISAVVAVPAPSTQAASIAAPIAAPALA